MVRWGQTSVQKCYLSSLEVIKEPITMAAIPRIEMDDANIGILDPRLGAKSERLVPIEYLKEVQIGPYITKSLSRELHCLNLKKNI